MSSFLKATRRNRKATGRREVRGEPDYRNLFESLPGFYLLMTPDFRIVTASQAYLWATHQKRNEIINCDMFDVFPDNPNLPAADGVSNLRAALDKVLHSGSPQMMRIQRYDVRDEVSGNGEWIEKYWSPSNFPLFASGSSEITHLVHRVQDVTSLMRSGRLPDLELLFADALEAIAASAQLDASEHRQELQFAERNFARALGRLSDIRRENLDTVNAALEHLESNVYLSLKRLEWRKPYYEAIFEGRPGWLKMRVGRARWAISRRIGELSILDRGKEAESELKELRRAYVTLSGIETTLPSHED